MTSLAVPVLSLAVLGAVGGCTSPPPPSQFPSATAALSRMKATFDCARGVQGEGKIDHMNKAGRIRGDIMFVVVDPDRVRFDVISPFGVNLATLTSNGRQFSFFDMKNKVFYEGPPAPCNIARLTQVRLPAHALVQLMRGEAPLLAHNPADATIAWNSGHYVVTLRSQHEALEEIHLVPTPDDFNLPYDRQRVRVLHVKVTQRDYVHYEADLLDHEVAETMPPRQDEYGIDPDIPPSGPPCRTEVPRRIHVEVPYTTDDFRFRSKEAGLNPPLPAGMFSQPVPGGVRRSFARCDEPG